jgi:hypothetical protein
VYLLEDGHVKTQRYAGGMPQEDGVEDCSDAYTNTLMEDAPPPTKNQATP